MSVMTLPWDVSYAPSSCLLKAVRLLRSCGAGPGPGPPGPRSAESRDLAVPAAVPRLLHARPSVRPSHCPQMCHGLDNSTSSQKRDLSIIYHNLPHVHT